MLSDGRVDSLNALLDQFKKNDQSRQHDLQRILKQYSQLLVDYKTLRRAYEEKEHDFTFKRDSGAATSSTSRVPYVMILVDGNNYIFNEELVSGKEEGGMRAARMLNDAVERYVYQSVPEARNARVIIRIYADTATLSKQLHRIKLTGGESRSISPFTAAFTRTIGSCDFIDTFDQDGTKFKIREQFKQACEDNACRRILYAACHDAAYLSPLVPFLGTRDKITLVQAAGWNTEFEKFNFEITQFPSVFRWAELPRADAPLRILSRRAAPVENKGTTNAASIQMTPVHASHPHSGTVNGGATHVVPTNQDIKTRKISFASSSSGPYRDDWWCNYPEKKATSPAVPRATEIHLQDSSDLIDVHGNGWSTPPDAESTSQSTSMLVSTITLTNEPNIEYNDHPKTDPISDDTSGPEVQVEAEAMAEPKYEEGDSYDLDSSDNQQNISPEMNDAASVDSTVVGSNYNVSNLLPTAVIPGFVPVNKDSQRLDLYLRPPTSEDWLIFNGRYQKKKLCNKFHLQGGCNKTTCRFEHKDIEPEAHHVLTYMMKSTPCPNESRCRDSRCMFGHICQKNDCNKKCKMRTDMHHVDPKLTSMVPAEDEPEIEMKSDEVGIPEDLREQNYRW